MRSRPAARESIVRRPGRVVEHDGAAAVPRARILYQHGPKLADGRGAVTGASCERQERGLRHDAAAHVLTEFPEYFHHLVSEWSCSHNTILGTLKFRRRHHLHGLRDLLRVLNRLNAPAYV